MTLLTRIETIVEALYTYRLSWLFQVHLILVIVLGMLILFYFWQEWKARKHAYVYDTPKNHSTSKPSEYAREVDKHTLEQVRKLRESAAYRDYLQRKNLPNSPYNRKIEVEEIVFSDEQEQERREQLAYEARIYGETKQKIR